MNYQVNADCIALCVIDDCLDSDVPLLDITLNELQVEQVKYRITNIKLTANASGFPSLIKMIRT